MCRANPRYFVYTDRMVAWGIGITGLALSAWLGITTFGWQAREVAISVGAANLAALVSGLLVLRLEKVRWIKAHVLTRSLKTWAVLAALFFGLLLALAPPLRVEGVLLRQLIPLLMSTGLMLNPVFGPVQDWLTRRAQARERSGG